MKRFKIVQRMISFALAFCLVVAGVFGTSGSTVYAAEGDEAAASTTVYFYNSGNWGEVGVHAWNDSSNLTGDWGSTKMTASSIGEGWYEAAIPADPTFQIIIFDTSDTTETVRVTSNVSDTTSVYFSMKGKYESKAAAEASVQSTTLYFYNSEGWAEVGAHAYNNGGNLTGDFGSTKMTTSSIGDDWYEVTISAAPSFELIVFDTSDETETKRTTVTIADQTNVYLTMQGKYATKAAAEVSINGAGSTKIYFYNSEDWAEVGVHAWGTAGDLTGGWGSTKMTASSIGDNWYEATIPSAPSFSVIIFNTSEDSSRITTAVNDTANVYFSMKGSFSSKESAEASVSASGLTTLYFYDSEGWGAVSAYCWYGEDPNTVMIEGGWPGKAAAAAPEIGDNWFKVEVSVDASTQPFNVIFNNNNGGKQTAGFYVTKSADNYATVNGVYSSKFEAEYSLDPTIGVTIYFYNSSEWETVNAYAYNDLLGGWPGVETTAADVTGDGAADDKWVKVVCPSLPSGIIFFNAAADTERAELGITDEEHVYVAMNEVAYTSAEELLNEVANAQAVIYFLNSDNWSQVYAYAEDNEGKYIGKDTPGIKATKDTTLGDENWYKVTIPTSAILNPFKVTFSNGGNKKTEAYDVTLNKDNYASMAGLYDSKSKALNSVGLGDVTTVYFLNSEDWDPIGAYVWGDPGPVLGTWGATTLGEEQVYSTVPVKEGDEEAGTKTWYKFEVPAGPPFNLIMFHKGDKQTEDNERIEAAITNKEVYVTPNGLWSSMEEAELSEGLGDLSRMTTVYFLNHRGWGDISAYTFTEKEDGSSVTLGKGWPGKAATKAENVGTSDDWWSMAVPKDASKEGNEFGIIFNDGVNQTDDVMIGDKEYVYAIAYGASHKLFKTAEEAEAAVAKDPYEDNCEEGPNTDILGYDVSYSGAGAALPFVTYEAEAASTNATVLEKQTEYREYIQSEASGRQAVELKAEGDYVEFTLTEAANSIVLRYAIPDSEDGTGIDATLSLYVDGKEKQDLDLTSKYAWLYGVYPFNNTPDSKDHRYYDEVRVLFDEEMPANTKIRLQKDAADKADYYVIDFIDCELVGAPNEQPENSLSVVDFGATPNDDTDDAEAFRQCIQAASEVGKEVWIPAGTFILEEEEALDVTAATIRGAGMWHTNLVGAGVSFHYRGTCKFYDFAMTGVSKVRDDSGDLACFEGMSRSTNVTIQNIWMEHVKVGVWANNTQNIAILGCRIRNTWADGINMCSGTYNAVVENNNVRNTGDDCIAIWPWLADCGNNTIRHNTIMSPSLANGVAIYGGYGHVVEANHVYDIIGNGGGICVGTEFDTAKPYSGTITVRDNLLERCGSMQFDENYPIGSVWIWAAGKAPLTGADAIIVENNTVKDSVHSSFLIECENEVDDVIIRNNKVEGGKDVIHVLKTSNGSGEQYGNTAEGYAGEFVNNENENFTFSEKVIISGIYGQTVSQMEVTGSLADGVKWTVTSDGDDIPEVGTEKAYTVSNGETEVQVVPVVAKKPITVTAADASKVYDGNAYAGELTFTHNADDLVGDDTVADLAVTLTLSDAAAVNAGEYAIVGTSESKNYEVTVTPGKLTITQAAAEITLAKETYTVPFGADDFSLAADVQVTGDGTPVFEVTEGTDVLAVSKDGMVSVQGIGTAVITVSLDETTNYAAAESKTITVNVSEEGVVDGIYANGIFDQTYTGSAIKPVPGVFDGLTGKKLVEGVDYTLKYKNNTKVYTAKEGEDGFNAKKAPQITIKGIGNYESSLTVYFTIQRKDIAAEDVVVTYTSELIAGNKAQKPLSKITYNGKTLKSSEYTVEYFTVDEAGNAGTKPTAVKAAGKYQMKITGKGSFTGSTTKDVIVYEKGAKTYLKDMVISVEGTTRTYSTPYTGKAIEPEVTVAPRNDKNNPISEEHYKVKYDNNTGIGTATITIEGKSEMGVIGTVTKTFKITGTALKNVAKINTEGWQKTVQYDITTGTAVQPTDENGKNLVKLTAKKKNDKTAFVEGVHYEVSYKNNDKPGKATMVFTGIGKYTGTITKTFTVSKIDMSKAGEKLAVTPVTTEAVYAKKGSTIDINVTYNGVTLEEGTHYKVTYKNNKAATTSTTKANKMPYASISGLGAFTGKVQETVPFTIKAADLKDMTISAADTAYQNKKGKYMVVPVVVAADGTKLKNKTDFTCEYYLGTGDDKKLLTKNDVVDAFETVTVVATAKGSNYTGSVSTTYEVKVQDISKASVSIAAQEYTGKAVEITKDDITKIKVGDTTLVEGEHYVIDQDSYVNNTNKGTATVTIEGIRNYGGTKKVTFKITGRVMAWVQNLFS